LVSGDSWDLFCKLVHLPNLLAIIAVGLRLCPAVKQAP
jgi:hypothetical protein